MFRGRRKPIAEVVRSVEYDLKGGEDLVTPAMKIADGMLIFSNNYEPAKGGGYQRVDGYERFDGRDKPSDTVIYGIPFDAGSTEPALGMSVAGRDSNARGIVSGVEITSGAWATNDAAGFLSVTFHSGTFIDDEDIIDAPLAFSTGLDDGFK